MSPAKPSSPRAPPVDLSVATFLVLREAFFAEGGKAVEFDLPDKGQTQDDPFDTRALDLLQRGLPAVVAGATSVKTAWPRGKGKKASGANTTPDLVVLREALCRGIEKAILLQDLSRIVALEVKKLERTAGGGVARASGMDYNTTPPCGVVRIYDAASNAVDVRGFYLFVCLERPADRRFRLTAMCLCDGNALNQDFAYYLDITGIRKKSIGLGTYADGADRRRPMLIFANPLGAPELDTRATLIHPSSALEQEGRGLKLVYTLSRVAGPQTHQFFCYRLPKDVPSDHTSKTIGFLAPKRNVATQQRSRFFLPFLFSDLPPST
jgi:hypothetical protein